MASKGKKRYLPPQPDEDTFETQEEFINCLQIVDTSSLSENNRRCGHCWKFYGESDPGCENAEQPVKLRCGHTFGELCMRDLFRLREVTKAELHPVDFSPGSSGLRLAETLDDYIGQFKENHQKAENSSAAPDNEKESSTPKDMTTIMSRLLTDIRNDKKAIGLPADWCYTMQTVLNLDRNFINIHFLNNGVICDIRGSTTHSTSMAQSFFGALPFEQAYIVDFQDPPASGTWPAIPYPHAASFAVAQVTATSSAPQDSTNLKLGSITTISSTTPSANIAEVAGGSSDSISTESSPATVEIPINNITYNPPSSGMMSYWEQLSSQNSQSTYIPSPAAGSGSNFLSLSGIQSVSSGISDAPCQSAKATKKTKANGTETSQADIDAAAIAKFEAMKKKKLALAAAREAERKKRLEGKVTIVSDALVRFMATYRDHIAQGITPSHSPPSKRLKKADGAHVSWTIPLRASTTLHKDDLKLTHYDILQPIGIASGLNYDFDSEDSAYDEENVDDVEDGGLASEKPGQMILLERSLCTCCFEGQSSEDAAWEIVSQSLPGSIGWRDNRQAPDSCPICRKVLFRKGRKH